jgi:hypothetical protein
VTWIELGWKAVCWAELRWIGLKRFEKGWKVWEVLKRVEKDWKGLRRVARFGKALKRPGSVEKDWAGWEGLKRIEKGWTRFKKDREGLNMIEKDRRGLKRVGTKKEGWEGFSTVEKDWKGWEELNRIKVWTGFHTLRRVEQDKELNRIKSWKGWEELNKIPYVGRPNGRFRSPTQIVKKSMGSVSVSRKTIAPPREIHVLGIRYFSSHSTIFNFSNTPRLRTLVLETVSPTKIIEKALVLYTIFENVSATRGNTCVLECFIAAARARFSTFATSPGWKHLFWKAHRTRATDWFCIVY